MGGHPGYYICIPISHLWASYPTHSRLDDIASHLETKGRLVNGSWAGIPTTATTPAEWFTQAPALKYPCLIFDDIQSFMLGEHPSDMVMVYAGPSVPPTPSVHHCVSRGNVTMKVKTEQERNWADVICPFESAYHPNCSERVSASLILANHR